MEANNIVSRYTVKDYDVCNLSNTSQNAMKIQNARKVNFWVGF